MRVRDARANVWGSRTRRPPERAARKLLPVRSCLARHSNEPKSGSWVIAVRAESAEQQGMDTSLPVLSPHPAGEQPSVEEWSTTADTFAGRVRVEWDSDGVVTTLGQLPFFIDYLKQAGLFAGWVADCPLTFSSLERAQQARLAGDSAAVGAVGPLPLCPHYDAAVRRGKPAAAGHEEGGERGRGAAGLAKIDEAAGSNVAARPHLDYCVRPLLSEPWVLDIDSTDQAVAWPPGRRQVVGYNPHKPGRPSHCYHTYLMANLRLVLGSMCSLAMNTRQSMASAGLWSLLHRPGAQPVAGSVARGCGMGALSRADGACRAGRAGLSASPAHDSKRHGVGTDQDDEPIATGRRRGMAGRARRPHCGWWAGAGSAASFCCGAADRPLVILEHTQPEAAAAQLCRGRV